MNEIGGERRGTRRDVEERDVNLRFTISRYHIYARVGNMHLFPYVWQFLSINSHGLMNI